MSATVLVLNLAYVGEGARPEHSGTYTAIAPRPPLIGRFFLRGGTTPTRSGLQFRAEPLKQTNASKPSVANRPRIYEFS